MRRARDVESSGPDAGDPVQPPHGRQVASDSRARVDRADGAWRGRAAWVAIVVIVVAGVLAQLLRPLAPDLGSVPDPARWFGAALLRRIHAFRNPLRVAAVAGELITAAVPLAVAVAPAGRRLVGRLVAAVGRQRTARAAAAVVAAVVMLTACARLPLGWWAYRHARTFGLSTQSPAGWLGDWAIARGVELVVVVALTLGGYVLLRRHPHRWYLIAAPLGVVVVAAAVLVAPLLLEPLRFDLEPLPAGPLRERLEAVLAADGRSRAPLLVADASRRTTTQNAYVSGLWGTRRIVLYDTLLEREPDEVAQVVAHELAHERHHDLARGVLGGAVGWVAVCIIAAVVLRWRVTRGRQRHTDDPHGAAAVLAVIMLALALSAPVAAWQSRRAEAAADLGALRLTGDATTFCAMQRGLVERNLSDPAPPTWQRLWFSTHPPAASRLALAQWWAGDSQRLRRISGGCQVGRHRVSGGR
jgi:STE24 endopeptidase